MTLHLAIVAGALVLQVGDRLLTLESDAGTAPWDAYANKSIYVEAVNGRVIVSYAGLAHINRVPTDEWLLRRIAGPWMPDGDAVQKAFSPATRLNLGTVTRAIVGAIERDLPRQTAVAPARRNMEVLITGWTWPRGVDAGSGRPTTFAVEIKHSGHAGSSCRVRRHRAMPAEGTSKTSLLLLIGRGKREWLQGLAREINSRTVSDVSTLEDMLAQRIRDAASADPTIGTDLMSFWLPPSYGDHDPRFRYLRDVTKSHPTLAFGPAVVGRKLVSRPFMFRGNGFSFGYAEEDGLAPSRGITFESVPPLPDDGYSMLAAQPRPTW